jgi:Flp pilus assembly protein TadG
LLGNKNKEGFNVNKLYSYLKDQTGTVIAMAAIMTPLILSMTGIGLDISSWMMAKRNLQTAADAAAMAAAWEVANGYTDTAEQVAIQEALRNGYAPADGGSLSITITEGDDGTTIAVSVAQNAPTMFSQMFISDVQIGGNASALVQAGEAGNYCMLSLETTAANAFVVNGTVDIDASGCGIAVNSSGEPALNANGAAGEVNIGDIQVVGTQDDADLLSPTSITESADPIEDPYADLAIPAFDECTEDEMNAGPVVGGAAASALLDASGVAVLCGGFDTANNSVGTLDPGVYIVDGGDFATGNNSTLAAEGVTIILTNSGGEDYGDNAAKININGSIDIVAPLADALDDDWEAFEGIAFYADRNLEEGNGNSCHSVTGTGAIEIDGALYSPSVCLDYGGGSDLADGGGCSRIIARTIRLHGNPDIASACEGSAAANIIGAGGDPTVRLVL